ncbi:MAG: hypothetical protein DWQ06_13925 [Calditrichaeota bacterium]|nr:MAG: hypothetical protein DWQ06_13925 [Calditrichota bacterium]
MKKRDKIFLFAFLLSLFFHVVFFYLPFNEIFAFNSSELDRIKSEPKKLDFVLKPPPKKDESREKIVRNENFNSEVPEQTNLLSQKISKAKDQEPKENLKKSDLPFVKGEQKNSFDISELAGKGKPDGSQNPQVAPSQETKESKKSEAEKRLLEKGRILQKERQENDFYNPRKESKFNPIFLTESKGNEQGKTNSSDGSGLYKQKRFDNQESFSGESGILSLSTREWKWAEYFEKYLAKVQEGWQPPSGYGSPFFFFGHTVEKFSIQRDGKVKILETIEVIGHESFQFSSEQALKNVKIPLPSGFPEDSLVVTIQMFYPETSYHRARRKEWETKFGPGIKSNNPVIKQSNESTE